MSLFNHYTRGGQVALHNLRMFKQIVFVTFGVMMVSGALTLGVLSWFKTTSYQWYLYQEKISGTYLNFGDPTSGKTIFTSPTGAKAEIRIIDLMHNRWFRGQIFKFEKILHQMLRISLYGMIIGALLTIGFFILRGRQQRAKKILTGDSVVQYKTFNKRLRNKRSDLKLAQCHLLQNAEMEHMLITGTTGAGKTNCLHELLPQIRARGNRAIIVDLRGNLVPTYYRPGRDILLNPYDARSENWHIWAECKTPYQFESMAEVLLPVDRYSSGDHEWWLKAGRAMFSVAAQKLLAENNFSMTRLKDLLIALPLKDITDFFKDTDMASFATKESERVASSVRNVLTPVLRKISCLRESRFAFSIRDWMTQDTGESWLFLSAGPDQKDTLQPLISTWLGWAIQSLKTMPETHKPRLWFICDELPQLKYLPTLEEGLAEMRGFGGCFVAGIQDYHQLQKIYGPDSAHTLLTLFNTKVVFNCPDKQTASYMAESFGERDTQERSEGLSFGAHDMRDGVTLNEHKKTETILRPSDLMTLPKLQAYLKTPGQYPPVHLHFEYQKAPQLQPKFIPRAEAPSVPKTESEAQNQEK